MGSKSRIAKYIVPIIQKCIDDNGITNYIEPFVGGANIIDKIKCENKIGNDKSSPLISLLQYVQDEKNVLPSCVSREYYSKVRASQNDFPLWEVGCVGFLASYNGRFFDGGYAKSGYEKTKNGYRYRDYYQEARANLLKQSKSQLFKDIIFMNFDYKELIDRNDFCNCFIYCDPPYKNTKNFSNSKDFNHDDFWASVAKLSKKNYVLISEENAPLEFKCIWEQEVSRTIKATNKSKSTEKLFTYKNGLFDNYFNKN